MGAPNQVRPRVILDVVLEKGFFYLVLKNIGVEPAIRVCTKISPRIDGPDGKKAVNDLNVFRNVEFLAPGRDYSVLVGSAVGYFSAKQPSRVTAVISYSDGDGNGFSETIVHDLDIFRDLPRRLD